MPNFNERHPPMGSETDRDNQTTVRRSEYISSSSSSSEELDELSLRVQSLLAESDDEQMPKFSSCKESLVHQESQMILEESQSSDTGHDIQATCSSPNLECHHHIDKVILPKKENEQDITALKDSCSKTDCDAYDIHETSFPHSHESVSSVTSHNKLEISDDLTSYYSLDENLGKQTLNNCLKERFLDTKLPLLGTSFSTSSEFFYNTPCENKEMLSVDIKSDNFSYFTPGFAPQQLHEKEKDCSSSSRYGDCDTSSLSVSSIESCKRLKKISTAKNRYAIDTVDESSSERKNRKETEGFSVAAHKHSYSASSKYEQGTKQQLSAKVTSLMAEGELIAKISQTPNLNDESFVSEDSYIIKDFSRKDKTLMDEVDEALEYLDTKSFIDFESNISFEEKEPKLQIHSDLSVRPKTYVMKESDSARKNILPKDPETNSYLKHAESEIIKSDFIENRHLNRDSEMSKKRVSFASSETFEGNVRVVGFMKPARDITQVKSFEHSCHMCHECSCHSYQSISDLPEEYQKHFLTAPVFINSEMLPSDNCSRRSITDSSISSSDVRPHIRWYPIQLYKSSQDIKNAATQTSLRQSKAAGTSSEMSNELDKNIVDSSNITQHLHVTKTTVKNPVEFTCLHRLQKWQAEDDVNLTLEYATKCAETDESNEFFSKTQQTEVESSDVIRHLPVKRIIDRNDLNIHQDLYIPQENSYRSLDEMNFKTVSGGIKRDEYDDIEDGMVTSAFQYNSNDGTDSPERRGAYIFTPNDKEFSFDNKGKVFKDASTQVKNCSCFIEINKMLLKTLDKISDILANRHRILEKEWEETKQTKRVLLHCEAYDVLFLDDNAYRILDAENSPLCFISTLKTPLRHVRKTKCVKRKKEKQWCNKEKKKQYLKAEYQNHAKKYSKILAKSATKGKVDYSRHERVLEKPRYY